MVSSAYILFGIALLSIILGFVALLSQKVYLDATTKQPTEVQIPFLGKIKSNYPALVFAFLGAALAFYAFQKSFPLPPPPLEDWTRLTFSLTQAGFKSTLKRRKERLSKTS